MRRFVTSTVERPANDVPEVLCARPQALAPREGRVDLVYIGWTIVVSAIAVATSSAEPLTPGIEPLECKGSIDVRSDRTDDLTREPEKPKGGVGLLVLLAGGSASGESWVDSECCC